MTHWLTEMPKLADTDPVSSHLTQIVACATHLMPLDRRVLSMSLPLVAQHLVVLVKYQSVPVYAVCGALAVTCLLI
jgi:hypothetical protein